MSISSEEQTLLSVEHCDAAIRKRRTEQVPDRLMYDTFEQGTKQSYDDFETIDWLRDLRKDSERHKWIEYEKKNSIKGRLVYILDSTSGWLLVFLVGITAGLLASFVDVGTTWITDLRHGICHHAYWLNREHCCWSSSNATYDKFKVVSCPEWRPWNELIGGYSFTDASSGKAYGINFVFYIASSLLFSAITVMFVKNLAPYACGSGIAEIKTILSGFIMRGFLGRWTLIVKSVGMMLATSTSLVIGKEGPFIHVGCCCGNILSYIFRKYGSNEGKKREILSAGAAAGLAVAFGAPLGGVLFSLEEISYYFPFKTLWRSFFCAMIGALVVRYVSPTAVDIQFAIDYTVPWFYFELIAFAILGVIGGIWGALFIRINSFWCNYRRNSKLREWDVTEVMALTFLTAFLFYPNPYTRMTMSKLIQLTVSKCTLADQTDLCDYDWKYPLDSATAKLIPIEAGPGVHSAIWQLLIALLLIGVFMVFSIGAKIPSGLMIPSMCIGAITGRIFGIANEIIVFKYPHAFPFKYECGSVDRECVTPGLYALVGACSFLAGVTKMTVSLVVVMFEISGGLRYIVPLMIATMVAKWTSDALVSGSIYDSDIRRQGYPFLDNKEEFRTEAIASDLLSLKHLSTPLVYLPKSGLPMHELVRVIESCYHSVIPIVTSERTRYLYGQVIAKDLSDIVQRLQRSVDHLWNDNQVIQFGCDDSADHSDDELLTGDVINLHRLVDTAPMTVADQEPVEVMIDLFRKMGLRHVYVLHEGLVRKLPVQLTVSSF